MMLIGEQRANLNRLIMIGDTMRIDLIVRVIVVKTIDCSSKPGKS